MINISFDDIDSPMVHLTHTFNSRIRHIKYEYCGVLILTEDYDQLILLEPVGDGKQRNWAVKQTSFPGIPHISSVAVWPPRFLISTPTGHVYSCKNPDSKKSRPLSLPAGTIIEQVIGKNEWVFLLLDNGKCWCSKDLHFFTELPFDQPIDKVFILSSFVIFCFRNCGVSYIYFSVLSQYVFNLWYQRFNPEYRNAISLWTLERLSISTLARKCVVSVIETRAYIYFVTDKGRAYQYSHPSSVVKSIPFFKSNPIAVGDQGCRVKSAGSDLSITNQD